jgi:hypothetical protein
MTKIDAMPASFGLTRRRGDAEKSDGLTQRTQRELKATEKNFAVLSLCLCVSV